MRKTFILLTILMLSVACYGKPLRQFQFNFQNEFGNPVSMTTSASIYVYSAGSTTELTLYLDQAGQTAVTQPITDDSTNTCLQYDRGLMSFWVDATKVKVQATDGTNSRILDNLTGSQVAIGWPSYLSAIAFETTKVTFKSNPVTSLIGGGATGAATGDENALAIDGVNFEYHLLGAGQTIESPSIVTGGLNISLDLTDDEGAEYGEGITAQSKSAFTAQTDAFYLKVKLDIADVSGTDDCAIGFRKIEAYATGINTYTDYAVLNVISGNITVETALNDTDASTDTTDDWADGAEKTLEVYVSAAGVATFKINGNAPTVNTGTVTFDAGDVIVPCVFLLHAATSPGVVYLSDYECGLQ